jgi:hypothetical protein
MKRVFQAVLIATALVTCVVAQDKPVDKPREERPLNFYKLEFVLRELQDGKVINTRNYMMTVEDGDRGSSRIGARVPVSNGVNEKGFSYMDIGINIDCRVVGRGDYASLGTTVEISSVALPDQTSNTAGLPPVLRQARANMAAVVPVNKATVIGVIDDANSTKRYEIAVTATNLK